MNDTINRYLAILCYPFASLDFFIEDYFEEIIQQESVEKRLKESIIQHIQKNCNVYSYDEVYMYLEKCYLHDIRAKQYCEVSQMYLDCLYKIVRSMISQRDGKVVFKYWKNSQDDDFLGGFGDSNKIFIFHSMNMHMPLDFIVMFYLAQNDKNDIGSLKNYYNQIDVADQQLDAVLKGGVAENHLHKGVSVSFYEIWEILMRPLCSHTVNAIRNMKLEFGDGNLKDGEVLFFILVAAIVRIWIALALNGKFWREKELDNLVQCFEDGMNLKEFYRMRWGNAEETMIKSGVLSYCQAQWESVLRILPPETEGRTCIQEIFQVPDQVHSSEETVFLFYCMKYLERCRQGRCEKFDGKRRHIFQCIMQYLRVRNYVFGWMVQKKTVRGLDFFQQEYYGKDSMLNKFYGDISAMMFKRKNAVVYWEQALRKQFYNHDLKKIEFRASINNSAAIFRKSVKDFLEAYRNVIREDYCRKKQGYYEVVQTFPRVGLVFHLLKKKDETIPYKCFLDGFDKKEKLQFGVQEQNYEEQVSNMCTLRDEVRGLDRYIVGLDAASLENATPVWVFTKAYNKARDSAIEKAGYDERAVQSLRFTFHAGEDFRHILSGLRRVDEAVTFLKFHAGDRIGHGTALGIPPEQWQRYNPFVVLPRDEALDNYIWAYYMLSQDNVEINSTLIAYIERRIYEFAKGIFAGTQGISLQVLTEGYLKMFDVSSDNYAKCREAEDIGFCREVRENVCSEIVWNSDKVVLARHCKKFLSEMERPINYEVTKQDIQITEILQKIVRRKLSRKGIVVEINPSSNIAIGEVDKITDHQIYKLNKPNGEDNVMVCINSDDPTVFHTNVSNEIGYIYYGMLYNGVNREAALEWIDKVRACGVKSSFLQGEEGDQQVYDQLEKLIEML